MVAKGLDYPDVTVVGVLNADTTLHLPDFRASERTFQMLSQVAGRAGRASSPGTVIIQTYWPSHPAIRAAASHNPELLYDRERAERREVGYPPYVRLANVVLSGAREDQVAKAAQKLATALRESAGYTATVLGPSAAPLARVKGAFRWHVMAKSESATDVSAIVRDALERVGRVPGVSVAPDIDPQDLL